MPGGVDEPCIFTRMPGESTVGDSGLCCCVCVTFSDRRLTPLCVDSYEDSFNPLFSAVQSLLSVFGEQTCEFVSLPPLPRPPSARLHRLCVPPTPAPSVMSHRWCVVFSASVMSHRWCVVFPSCHVTPLVCCFSVLSCHTVGVLFFRPVMSHRWCVVFPLLSCHTVGVLLFSARFKRKNKAAHTHH